MSVLRVDQDDFPDAAAKHLDDARSLQVARRYDGACYLLGYVVECCLKSVRLHDQAWRPGPPPGHDSRALRTAHREMARQPFGHDLLYLLFATIGPHGARYLPLIHGSASIFDWRPERRYRSPAPEAPTQVIAWMEWAEHVFNQTLIEMQLDGVI